MKINDRIARRVVRKDALLEWAKETRLGLVLDGMAEGGRFNPIEDIVGNAMADSRKKQDSVLRDAFLHHFGFPLEQVQDKENLEHIVVEGQDVSSFRYRGETFLYWKDEFDVKETVDCITFTQWFSEV